jgi:iodotyrosine deiodinase
MGGKVRFSATGYREYPIEEMKKRAHDFYEEMRLRRSVRQFSKRPVSKRIIEDCLRAACTAPSGANLQPWHFYVVSDPEMKKKIRSGAEKGETKFYQKDASKAQLEKLSSLGTTAIKPFLEAAPYLIAVFAEFPPGSGEKNDYYIEESVGVATGVLITAIHHAGLASLCYTPSNSLFLNEIFKLPSHSRAFLILVVGYPDPDSTVPGLEKKSFKEVVTFI